MAAVMPGAGSTASENQQQEKQGNSAHKDHPR
jgi:hypothetical protein